MFSLLKQLKCKLFNRPEMSVYLPLQIESRRPMVRPPLHVLLLYHVYWASMQSMISQRTLPVWEKLYASCMPSCSVLPLLLERGLQAPCKYESSKPEQSKIVFLSLCKALGSMSTTQYQAISFSSWCLCIKTNLHAKLFIWKWVWFAPKWTCRGNLFSYKRFCTKIPFDTGQRLPGKYGLHWSRLMGMNWI